MTPLLLRFLRGFEHGFGIDETVFGRAGLVKGRLRAKAAILRTRAGLGVDDGAEMNLVALEMFADAVGPGHQIENVRCGFKAEQSERLLAGDLAAVEDARCQVGNFRRNFASTTSSIMVDMLLKRPGDSRPKVKMAQKFLRRGRHADGALLKRVRVGQFHRPQSKVPASPAVERISQDRMSARRQMDANLVRPPVQAWPGSMPCPPVAAKHGTRFGRPFRFVRQRAFAPSRRVPGKSSTGIPTRFLRNPINHGKILFANEPGFKKLAQCAQRARALCQQKHAAGLRVKPVNESDIF